MWGFAWTVFMRVSGTPHRPKPPARRVVLPAMFSRAAEAEGRILLISFRERVVEKVRVCREDDRRVEAARRQMVFWQTMMAICRIASSFNVLI